MAMRSRKFRQLSMTWRELGCVTAAGAITPRKTTRRSCPIWWTQLDRGDDGNDDGDDDVKRKIRDVLEVNCRSLENCQAEGFKRRLMTLLRRRGFDAGLCKSQWEKTSRCPGREHEYIDVVVSESRYVVEVFLAGEFTIARPTSSYQSLLRLFPRVMVVKQFELKQMVRLMCAEMKNSMKIRDMPVPPWRKNGYMQAKWFGPYKRTVNAIPTVNRRLQCRVCRKGVDRFTGGV
ncbi:hypothetical protein CK203_014040 [Vitis vinifera]|uniref:DUF506 family protein n=1 Tax=Vitis vinifera TaxID=29760 RepID=A0A438JHJ6_VITVI|nr:hypothetical protein CK203_014040 [Vitis vinifera]